MGEGAGRCQRKGVAIQTGQRSCIRLGREGCELRWWLGTRRSLDVHMALHSTSVTYTMHAMHALPSDRCGRVSECNVWTVDGAKQPLGAGGFFLLTSPPL